MSGSYIPLKELKVYQLAWELAEIGWNIYNPLHWQDKKIMGNQFIKATDSVGANVAEGYGRFHYLDKIKFYYNSRGSLFEAHEHWLELLQKRNKLESGYYKNYKEKAEYLVHVLNRFISSHYCKK